MFQGIEQVLHNEPIQPDFYRMGVTCPEGYTHAVAGQFVTLRLPARQAPLLRRPFSIHRLLVTEGRTIGIELLYRVVGPMTRALSDRKIGDRIDMVGPLGRGFGIPDGCRKACIAGGGVGVAPLLFLAESLVASGMAAEAVAVFVGGRCSGDLLCIEDFSRLGMRVVATTDDGSAGDRCLVTHPLEQTVRSTPPDIIYACGPPGMLECVAGIARGCNVPCQISVETMMGCGMGACLGCAVESRQREDRYLHACLDGPVFDAGRIKCNFH